MSDLYLLVIALIAVLLSVVSVLSIPWLLAKTDKNADDNWRDTTGGLIKILRPLLRAYSHHIVAHISNEKTQRMSERLQSAGLVYALTAAEFIVLKRFSLIVAFLLSLCLVMVFDIRDYVLVINMLLIALLLGYYYPDIWLRDKLIYRQKEIGRQFPFLLDMLVLTMRAGLPFPGAVQQALSKMPDGPLRYELNRYQRDIRTGMNRAEALERFDKRIRLSAVTNFVASIIQADESGGSITRVLGEQAKQRRKERFLKAEKKANEAPVKMLLPLIGLLFPITFIIIAVPIVVQLMESGLLEKVIP